MSDRISVLVADDHEIVRSGLIGVGNRPCGLRPDVVLMDLKMPHVNGWKATERIRAWQVADPHISARRAESGALYDSGDGSVTVTEPRSE